MKNLTKLGATLTFLVSFFSAAAQQPGTIVNLKVIHNGREKPTPAQIKVTFAGHSLRLPLREGKFEPPLELLSANQVTVETDVEGSHIRLVHVSGKDFAVPEWTLRLAERANDDYYEWPGPRGADIPTTCMLEFESAHSDPARVLFEQHCRNTKKQSGH